jgi:DNA polymerase-3 subunit psi
MMDDVQRLKNMGIRVWQLRKPEHYPDHQPKVVIPETCRLLLVTDQTPNEADAWLFGKIIASMQVMPEACFYLSSEGFSYLDEHQLDWCWFAGIKASPMANVRVLSSPCLSQLHHDLNAKKALWHQIKQAVTLK